MRSVKSWLLVAWWVIGAGLDAGAGALRPFTGDADVARRSELENRVWAPVYEFDEALRASGSLYEEPALTNYLHGILRKLYPEFSTFRVRVVRDPDFYAFVLPNGSLYVNTGMLAKLENEAQIACILAHEAAHFVHRHGFQAQQKAKRVAGWMQGLAVLRVPLAPSLLGASSIFGFSRDLERVADEEGHRRLRAAGYDLREAPKVFRLLLADLEALDIDEPVFFSSHPRLKERIRNFESFAARQGAPAGVVGREEYLARTRGAYLSSLGVEVQLRRFKSVIRQLADDAGRPGIAQLGYYLGQAYRQRAGPGDEARAEAEFRRAIAQAPDFAPTYFALGSLCRHAGRQDEAQIHLHRYLELAPGGEHAAYARDYLQSSSPASPR